MSSITSASGPDQRPLAAWQRRLAAILEVLGVFMAGQLVATLLIVGLGVPVQNPLALLDAGPEVNLLALSRNLALVLGFQDVGLLLPAMLIGWWYRPLPAYGLTTAGRPLTTHLGFCEELGWTGLAVPRLWQRHGVLATGLLVGIVWGASHFPLFRESSTAPRQRRTDLGQKGGERDGRKRNE